MLRTACLALLVLTSCGSPSLTLESARVHGLLAQMSHADGQVRARAEFELGRLGPGEVAAVIERLECGDPKLRWAAAYVLGPMGRRAKAAVPALLEALEDEDPAIRVWAVKSIGDIDPERPEAVAALARALRDADPDVRRVTITVLVDLGPKAKTFAPALIDLLDDPDVGVRNRASQALIGIGPEALPAIRPAAEGDGTIARGAKEILAAADAAAPAPPPAAVMAGAAERAQGYNHAKFGLFVHWGLYAVPHRSKPGALSERVMDHEKLPVKEYEKFAAGFTASKFDAAEWVRIAREAGARYLVLPAKSPDGFCLWDTKLTDFNSKAFAAAKRDVVGELSAACEKGGMRFGVSYSMLDWRHPDYDDRFPKYVDGMHAQLRELLTKYPIWGVWFEGEADHLSPEWKADDLLLMIRKLRPKAVVNDRLGRETRGTILGVDFYTKEHALRLQHRPVAWEACQTFGTSGGYTESPDPLKSGERLIEQLVDVVSKGGNFLLHVGPRADGTIPEVFQDRMKVIGAWLRKNGEAIYDTEPSPFGGPIPAGRVTMKGKRLYLFLEELPKGRIVLPGLKDHVKRAWLLDGGRELDVTLFGITPPEKLVDPTFTVVAIELDAPPKLDR